MSTSQNPPTGRLHSSRRNLIRMGAVAAVAIVAKTTSAAANRFDWDDDRWSRHHHHDRHQQEGRADKEHCFLKGTMIRTVQGDKKIEDLTVDELLPTALAVRSRSNRLLAIVLGG